MVDQVIIDGESFRRGTIQVIAELHITGGARAVQRPDRNWAWYPILDDTQIRKLDAKPIQHVEALASALNIELFGGDQLSGLEGPLVSRVWTPLHGPHRGGLQPADLWRAIARNAENAGDTPYATLARHIAYSLTAAGIRLRDASDCYHAQLMAAIHSSTKSGSRFANIPMQDLELAFHSVLSELASARDYLAALIAAKLGAPAKVDAMNRFSEWASAQDRAHLAAGPVASAMLNAYDADSADPWLHRLTKYRNLYTHRQPLGSGDSPSQLVYETVEHAGFVFPRITMPLAPSDPMAQGQDALTHFLQLYRKMTQLIELAANHAPYDTTLLNFTVK